jgi:hypothetical protein
LRAATALRRRACWRRLSALHFPIGVLLLDDRGGVGLDFLERTDQLFSASSETAVRVTAHSTCSPSVSKREAAIAKTMLGDAALPLISIFLK